jgi:hypothetical protein
MYCWVLSKQINFFSLSPFSSVYVCFIKTAENFEQSVLCNRGKCRKAVKSVAKLSWIKLKTVTKCFRVHFSPKRLRQDNELNDLQTQRQCIPAGSLSRRWTSLSAPAGSVSFASLSSPPASKQPLFLPPQHVALNHHAGGREESRSSPALLS